MFNFKSHLAKRLGLLSCGGQCCCRGLCRRLPLSQQLLPVEEPQPHTCPDTRYRLSALRAENLGRVHGLAAFLYLVQPWWLPSSFLVFPAAFKRSGFSGFLRSGVHTPCATRKRPLGEHSTERFRSHLKRNPPFGRNAVAQVVPPRFVLVNSLRLCLFPGAVLIH